MRNLTLAVDEEILLASRKLALERNTTVNKLVRDFLSELVREDGRRKAAAARLKDRMQKGLYVVGEKGWTRDELHER